MSWPERETLDEMLKRIKRKVEGERRAQAAMQSARDRTQRDRLDRPRLKRRCLPPQQTRFPTDAELDQLWAGA